MLSLTVEAADDLLANSRLLRWISAVHHAFRQAGQFVSRQLALSIELVRKSDYAYLFFRTEPLDFLDNLIRSHAQILSRLFDPSNSTHRVTRMLPKCRA